MKRLDLRVMTHRVQNLDKNLKSRHLALSVSQKTHRPSKQ